MNIVAIIRRRIKQLNQVTGIKVEAFGSMSLIHKRLLLRKILGKLQARYRVGVDKSLIVRQEQC